MFESMAVFCSFLLLCCIPFLCICLYYYLSLSHSTDRHLNCFKFLAFMNNVVMNIYVHVFGCTLCVYVGHIPRMELLIYRNCICSDLVKIAKQFFKVVETIYTPTISIWNSSCSTPSLHLVLSVLFTILTISVVCAVSHWSFNFHFSGD